MKKKRNKKILLEVLCSGPKQYDSSDKLINLLVADVRVCIVCTLNVSGVDG